MNNYLHVSEFSFIKNRIENMEIWNKNRFFIDLLYSSLNSGVAAVTQ